MKLSVVIPVYNESVTVEEIISRVEQTPFEKEIVVVDDASSDGTFEKLTALASRYSNLLVFRHDKNQGKGAALRTAFENVTGDVIVIQDADLEYSPSDYPALLEPIIDGRADVVYGSRFLGGPHRVLYFWHYVGNSLITLISNMVTNLNLSDMETGYKAFKAEVVRKMNLKSDRFGFEPEFTVKVARQGCRIYEVPISYSGRTYAEGKKITWRDGIAAIYCLIRFKLFR